MEKQLLSAVAVVLTFAAFLPYIRSIFKGTTKPHVFSWVIWGSVTFVVGIAALTDKAGAGAWPIVISGLVTMYVAALAYTEARRGHDHRPTGSSLSRPSRRCRSGISRRTRYGRW